MGTSGLSSIGTTQGATQTLADATTNPTTGEVGALAHHFNGATWDRTRQPNVMKQGAALAIGNTAVWTPATGKKFRLQRLMVMLSGDAVLAAAGRLGITVNDGGTTLGLWWEPWVPAAPLNNSGLLFSSGWVDLGAGFLSAAANNVLNINLSAGLNAGVARIITAGTEE